MAAPTTSCWTRSLRAVCPATLLGIVCYETALAEALTLPTLAFDGADAGKVTATATVKLPVLAFDGKEVPAPAQAIGLEFFRFPTDRRSGKYLTLDSATFAKGQPVQINYAGLPVSGAAHRLMIFRYQLEADGSLNTGHAWNSVPARTAYSSGRWERSDLWEGQYLVCLGLGESMPDYAPVPSAYTECLGFFVMTPVPALPVPELTLSTATPRARQRFEIRYQGLGSAPDTWLGLFKEGEIASSRVAFHETGGAAEGAWRLHVDSPGKYFVRVFYDPRNTLPRGLGMITVTD